MAAANRTAAAIPVNSENPATWLKPDEPLIGMDGRDWSWCYVWFKDIEGFPGYKVGADGSVWGCREGEQAGYLAGMRSRITWDWRRVTGARDTGGYFGINLRRDGRSFRRTIHRLVLEAFVGLRPAGMQCRHLDGNQENNCLSNLMWGTPKSNQLDRVRHGTHLVGSNVGTAKLDELSVKLIRKRFLEAPNKKRIAAQFGVSRNTISRVVNGECWRHVS